MQLFSYVNIRELEELINNGFVSERKHNELPLFIYNYTKKASGVSRHHWSDTLSRCRGLIVDDLGRIVAFGQPKFWNYVDDEDRIVHPFKVYDKLDGSLGIVYRYDGYMGIATRGSFHSEQAEWATEFIKDKPDYQEYFNTLITNKWTPHVEIIYNDNKIVVDYDYEDLVLLGNQAVQADDLYGIVLNWIGPHDSYPGPKAEEFKFASVEEMLNSGSRDNTEGFIIVDAAHQKYKIKYKEYVDLHRAIFHMTEKNLYEIWRNEVGREVSEYVYALPNELQDEAWSIFNSFEEKETEAAHQADEYMRQVKNAIRKEFALKVNELDIPKQYRQALFLKWEENWDRLGEWTLEQARP